MIYYGLQSGVVGLSKSELVLVDAECTHDGSIKHIQKFENWGWTTLERRVLDAERTDDLTVLQVGLISEVTGNRWFQMLALQTSYSESKMGFEWTCCCSIESVFDSLLALCLLKPLGFG
ncbi:hypothetical protein Tco_1211687 [Tanacetum coccineum]